MATTTDWASLMTTLGRDFATRSAQHDQDDSFVAENYNALRERGAFAAGVPAELGGGDAAHAELCAMIRELGRHCGSTALAFSMHTHLVGTLAYLWRSGNKAPEPVLKRVAAENLILVSSGGSDWLNGSGRLEKVDGGFRLTGRKIFSSGVPSGDILMTTGVYDDPESGPTVFHFPLPLKAEGVKVLDTWRTLGMRGTGSHDVEITDVFLPDAVMQGVRRPAGKWHPFMHAVALAPADFQRRLSGRRREGAGDRARPRGAAQGRSAHRGHRRRAREPDRHCANRSRRDGVADRHRQARTRHHERDDVPPDDFRHRDPAGCRESAGARRRRGLLSSGGSRPMLPRPAGRPISSTHGKRADVPHGTRAARFAVRRVINDGYERCGAFRSAH